MDSSTSDPVTAQNIVTEGTHVILVENQTRYSFLKVQAGSKAVVGKQKVSVDPILGCPFGSFFELRGKELYRLTSKPVLNIEGLETATETTGDQADSAEPALIEVTEDNRDIIDDNTAQKLTAEELAELRKQGLSGQEIIQKLAAHSASFQKKTQFSKAKYIKKKKEKYLHIVQIVKPTARTICQAYFVKSPFKTGYMRIDTLSQMLVQCDVRFNTNIVVYDCISGLLLAAVAERLLGYGCIISVNRNKVNTKLLDMLNLTPEQKSIVYHVSFSEFESLRRGETLPSELPRDESQSNAKMDVTDSSQCNQPEQPATQTEVSSDSQAQKKPQRKPKDFSEVREALSKGIDALLLAPDTTDDPFTVFRLLYPALAPSCPFSVYSQYSQGLAHLYKELSDNKAAVHLRLAETWLREYQVLPQRTHPLMQMSGSSGYTLGGYKIKSTYLMPKDNVDTMNVDEEKLDTSLENANQAKRVKLE